MYSCEAVCVCVRITKKKMLNAFNRTSIYASLNTMNLLSLDKVLVEGSAVALAGVGYFAIRRLSQTPKHYPDLEHTSFVKHSAFAGPVVDLKSLGHEELWMEFVYTLDEFIDVSREETHAKAWIANRLITQMKDSAQSMILHAKRSRNMDLIDAAISVESDVMPTLERIFDETIHNMLLSL